MLHSCHCDNHHNRSKLSAFGMEQFLLNRDDTSWMPDSSSDHGSAEVRHARIVKLLEETEKALGASKECEHGRRDQKTKQE